MEDHVGTVILSVVLAIVAICIGLGWKMSCKSAEIYDRINNATYTCSDFFWAAEQINTQTQTIKLK